MVILCVGGRVNRIPWRELAKKLQECKFLVEEYSNQRSQHYMLYGEKHLQS